MKVSECMLPKAIEADIKAIKEISLPRDLLLSLRSIPERSKQDWIPRLAFQLAAACSILIVAAYISFSPITASLSDEEFANFVLEAEIPIIPDEILDSDLLVIERIV